MATPACLLCGVPCVSSSSSSSSTASSSSVCLSCSAATDHMKREVTRTPPSPAYPCRRARRPQSPAALHLSDLGLHDQDHFHDDDYDKHNTHPSSIPGRPPLPHTSNTHLGLGLVHAEVLLPGEGQHSTTDMCAACHFFLGLTKGVRALGKLFHPECFCCAVCGQALFLLEEEEEEEGGKEGGREGGTTSGEAVSFFSVDGLPLCQEHFLEAWKDEEEEGEEEEEEEEEEGERLSTVSYDTAVGDEVTHAGEEEEEEEGEEDEEHASDASSTSSKSSFLTVPPEDEDGREGGTLAMTSPTARQGGGGVHFAAASTPTRTRATTTTTTTTTNTEPSISFTPPALASTSASAATAAAAAATPAFPSSVSAHNSPRFASVDGLRRLGLEGGREEGREEGLSRGATGTDTTSSSITLPHFSRAALRRSKSAITLRPQQQQQQPQQQQHRREGSMVSFVAAEETTEERDERVRRSGHRKRASLVYDVRELLEGREGGREGGEEEEEVKEGEEEEEEEDVISSWRRRGPLKPTSTSKTADPPSSSSSSSSSSAPPPPLTIGTALSYGIQVAAAQEKEKKLAKAQHLHGEADNDEGGKEGGKAGGRKGSGKNRGGGNEDIFKARVQMELVYNGTSSSSSSSSSSFFWEEMAPEVFRQIRGVFGVSEEGYRRSLLSIVSGGGAEGGSPVTSGNGGGGSGGGGGGGGLGGWGGGGRKKAKNGGNSSSSNNSDEREKNGGAAAAAAAAAVAAAAAASPGGGGGWARPTFRHSTPCIGEGGKSGSLFFKSHDETLLLKTTNDAEHAFLLSLLRDYFFLILARGTQTLLPRFLGLYSIKLPGQPAVKLICMKNIFSRAVPALRLLEKFDLKGSLLKRRVLLPHDHTPPSSSSSSSSSTPPLSTRSRHIPVQKDLNFCSRHDGTDDAGQAFKGGREGGTEGGGGGGCRVLRLGAERKKELLSYLAADVEWLRRHGVMDYSLLIGVCSIQELATKHRWGGGGREGGGEGAPLAVLEALKAQAPDEVSRQCLFSLWCPSYPSAAASAGAGAAGATMTATTTTTPPKTTQGADALSIPVPPPLPSLVSAPAAAPLQQATTPGRPFSSSSSSSTAAVTPSPPPPPPLASSSSSSSTSIFKTQEVFMLGLVDILQTYTMKRRLETLIKGAGYTIEGQDPRSISVVEPDNFAHRFLEFIDKHTV